MKKKWIAAAFACSMLVTGSAGVVAGANLQQIKAYLNHSLRIEVDGSAYALKDGNGKALTPITYGGLTYLPTQALARALDVPIAYDAANYKIRIGQSAPAQGGSGTSAPVVTRQRPANLPLDFPIPPDAVLTITADGALDGVKKVVFKYVTEESLETMGFVYKEYSRIKGSSNTTEIATANTVNIAGKLGGESPFTVKGAVSATQKGYSEFTVTWSES